MQVGLHMNAKKTQDGSNLKEVKDFKFKYLGPWMQSTEADIRTRKAIAWKSCNNLNNIWRSNLTKNIKVKLFQATVESVPLYGSETWTVTNKIGKSLDDCYTGMLRKALDVGWKDHIHVPNKELYGDLPKITTQISKKRLQFAGHCKRS